MTQQTIFYDSEGWVRCIDKADSRATINGAQKAVADTDEVGEITLNHKVTVDNGKVVSTEHFPPPGPTLEDKRKRAQLSRESFMLALKKAGIYGQAKQYANNLADDHDWRIRWEHAAIFNRTDPDLIEGAKDMGLTDEDLDTIFGVE